jgi:hypothetical protein
LLLQLAARGEFQQAPFRPSNHRKRGGNASSPGRSFEFSAGIRIQYARSLPCKKGVHLNSNNIFSACKS